MPINLRDKLSFLFNGGRGIGNDQLEGPIVKSATPSGASLTIVSQLADGTEQTEHFNPQAASGDLSAYVSRPTAYDATAHTLTFTIGGNPDLSVANGVYFVVPSSIDKQTDELTIHLSHNVLTYALYDSDLLRVSANELEPGQLYEVRVLVIGGQRAMVLTEPVVSNHGRFDKYLLYMGAAVADNLPTQADFLNTAISAHTRERFATFATAVASIDERGGRRWFACPFDDIETIGINPYSTVGNIRPDVGTPAIGGQTVSFAPYPIMINSRQFYAYGTFSTNSNPQFFAQSNDFYDMKRY